MNKKYSLPLLLMLGMVTACQKEAAPPPPVSSAPVTSPAPAPAVPVAEQKPAAPELAAPAQPEPAAARPAKAVQTPRAASAAEKSTPSENKQVAIAAPARVAKPVEIPPPPKPAPAVAAEKPEPPQTASDADFDAKVVQSSRPVLVYVVADFCAHCRPGIQVVDEIAAQYSGRMKVVTINIKNSDQTVKKYNVEKLPTTFLFKKGKVDATNIGWDSKADLTAFIEGNL